jgi:putative chitinase
MNFNETTLFTYLRRSPFGGRLAQDQVDGVRLLIETCRANRVTDLRHVANILAQVFHETGGRMQPVRETFAPSDAQAVARLDAAWAAGKLKGVSTPYWRQGWFGRGHIQITHKDNYERLGRRIGANIVGKPSLALEPETSARIAVIGMRDGLFTGKKLSDYFGGPVDDPRGARRIVNGSDKAALIAGYHATILDALRAAETTTQQPQDVSKEAAAPDDVKPSESPSLWTILVTFLGGSGGLATLGGINNLFALIAFLAILSAGGVFAYLVLTGRVTFNRSP